MAVFVQLVFIAGAQDVATFLHVAFCSVAPIFANLEIFPLGHKMQIPSGKIQQLAVCADTFVNAKKPIKANNKLNFFIGNKI